MVAADHINLKKIFEGEIPQITARLMTFLMTHMQTKTLEYENVQNLLNDPTEHFDVLVLEWMLVNLFSGYVMNGLYDVNIKKKKTGLKKIIFVRLSFCHFNHPE